MQLFPKKKTITKISWLMLFRGIISAYSENYMNPVNTLCGQIAELLNVKAGDAYSYLCALKGEPLNISVVNFHLLE
jgi:hypothetical protein